ncbi:hypothetical protein [Tropicimonas sediminicola]|uniref:Uncharacterized protein n=1 Tax=Tropicimonas sediminicola TaxID=1031541 RepID=A0A239MJE7_9RHOB|nr:hypothetical protein [Tropicimonas sediminicola]SNT41919.1 hypothetical protein SAMN05421757_12015 [Tropicimonas sediminicola]
MSELPIVEADGQQVLWEHLIAYCYVAYPENEQDALRALETLVSENEAMQAGLQDGYGDIGVMINKRITSRINNARLAGLVFYQMILNSQERGSPDFRKAVFAVAEWASVTKTNFGKALPSSGDNLRKLHFPMFKSAIHYWAAFQLLPETDQIRVFSDENSFTRLMTTAAQIYKLACELGVPKQTRAMRDWDPWLVPKVYSDMVLSGDVSVCLPPETDEIRSLLKGYRNKPFENPIY